MQGQRAHGCDSVPTFSSVLISLPFTNASARTGTHTILRFHLICFSDFFVSSNSLGTRILGSNIGGNQADMHQCKTTGKLCDSENIWVRDCNLTDNFRNAMSVTGVVNLTVERTLLAKTGGTCCMGGVDLEPEINERQERSCRFPSFYWTFAERLRYFATLFASPPFSSTFFERPTITYGPRAHLNAVCNQ